MIKAFDCGMHTNFTRTDERTVAPRGGTQDAWQESSTIVHPWQCHTEQNNRAYQCQTAQSPASQAQPALPAWCEGKMQTAQDLDRYSQIQRQTPHS
jgi:hypothetical protein